MLDRRRFLSVAGTGAAAGFASSLTLGSNLFAQLEKAPALPDRSLLDKNEDAYWAELRKQFLIPEDEVYLNNGTVGSSPAPVLRAIFDGYNTTEKLDQHDPEDYPIWGYAALERIPRSSRRFRRMQTGRDCPSAKCNRGEQLHRERPGHESRR